VFQPGLPAGERTALLALFSEFGRQESSAPLFELLAGEDAPAVKLAVLNALAKYDATRVATPLIAIYSSQPSEVRQRILDLLFSRPDATLVLLQTVDAGGFEKAEIPLEQLRRAALHKNAIVDELVQKHWGNVGPGSSEEKLATIRRFNNDLRAATGDPTAGAPLFAKHCGTCHQLFGEGGRIGPDLTTANRGDRAALLASIVDPSSVIRREYLNFIVTTTSGRILTGLIAEQDGASLTILDANNQRTRITRDEIDEIHEAEASLMPERLLEPLSPQERRDLFAYLQSTAAPQKPVEATR
jgi:putative heme-binding domain-containing protein